jgi:ribosomal-protein-alanine N-acetyltransferase
MKMMFGRQPKIVSRGERVYIFAPARDTTEDFVQFAVANHDFHSPWVYPATDAASYRQYLDRLEETGGYGFVVARREDNAIVGVININDVIMGGFRSASLGYYGSRACARRGYMREALTLVLDQAFGTVGLHRIEANIQPTNAASIGLVTGLGFRKEGFSPAFLQIGGVWRDHERWAILGEEWHYRRNEARRVSRVV